MKNMTIKAEPKKEFSITNNKQQEAPEISDNLKKENHPIKTTGLSSTRFQPRKVESFSSSIISSRGSSSIKDSINSNQVIDTHLKSQADRLSSLQSLLKVIYNIKRSCDIFI